MAYSRGRCTNIDYCPLAASRRDIEVKVGEPFMCPECARPLMAPQPKEARIGGAGIVVGGTMVAISLIVGGVYAGYRLSSPASIVTADSPPAAPQHPASTAMASLAAVAAVPAPAVMAPPPANLPPPAAVQPPDPPPATPPQHLLPQLAMAQPTPPPAALAQSTPVPTPSQRADPSVLLRLAGSPDMTAALAPRLAAAYLASLGSLGVKAQPGQVPGQTLVTGQRLSRPESVSIAAQSDSAGLLALGSGTADVALAARRITRAEMNRVAALDGLSTPASEHPVASEGLAVIVNPRNRLAQISIAQLRGVLDGSIADWPALGGTGQGIHVLVENGSPSLSDLVAGTPAVPPGARHVADAAGATFADPDAIAIVPAYRAGQAKILAVAVVGASPALPTPDAVAGDAYPLVRRLYLYAPAGAANPFVARFIAFALSPEGQDAVRQAGLVPITAQGPVPAAALTPKDRYKLLVAGAARLAADLHFEPGSNRLDLRSAREVDRVWNVMLSDHTSPDHLILLGFADNIGSPEANTYIAKQRAQAVADVFAHRGLPPGKVVSFGPELPIADNATAEGREKNRRVEVYLRQ